MGGVIIRAALPHLAKLKDKMHGYLTLCTPHLGYTYKTSKTVSTGMWFIKKWKKAVSISQLSMTDKKNMKDSCLYQLSTQPGLNWFKHTILVSSFQD
mmetsp:Transcript_13777/g.9754  ORF Transcript_13777/g.9754 Transcript_13777/m.9754 type:complete len:97 (+) Transcript_13777:2183-2473(+)